MNQIHCNRCGRVYVSNMRWFTWEGLRCKKCQRFYCEPCYDITWCCGEKLDPTIPEIVQETQGQ